MNSNELEGKAVIGKVNIDENSDVPVNYGVRNIPTLLVFKNGEVVDKVVGNQPKSKLLETNLTCKIIKRAYALFLF